MIGEASPSEVRRSVLFSVTDRQMGAFLGEKSFERSLVLGVLFQPNIFMPDIFFFISEPLYSHVHGHRRMLFEQAVRDGLIIPSFRERGTSSFHEALQVVEQAGIRGLLPPEQRLEIADRLDEVARGGLKYTTWPTASVANRYGSLITDVMTREEPPLYGAETDSQIQEVISTWNHSQKWRLDCLATAISESGTELRRGTYMAEIARSVGLDGPVDDVDAIFGAAQEAGYNPEKLTALRNICLLMNDCYLYNMAAEHGCYPDFPRHDAWSTALLNSTVNKSKIITPVDDWPTLILDVAIPPIESLLDMSAIALMRIRDEYGIAYLTAVRTWQRQANDHNANEVRERLTEYAEIVGREFSRSGNQRRDRLVVAHQANMQLGWQVARLGANVIGSGMATASSIADVTDPQSSLGGLLALGAIPAALVAVYETGTTIVGIRRNAELRRTLEKRRRAEEATVILRANQELSIPLYEADD